MHFKSVFCNYAVRFFFPMKTFTSTYKREETHLRLADAWSISGRAKNDFIPKKDSFKIKFYIIKKKNH